MNEEVAKETYIDDTLEDVSNENDTPSGVDEEVSENAEEEALAKTPIFEEDTWQDKVMAFDREYPMAREYYKEIGESILESEELMNDENCLEKAFLKILCKRYQPDSLKASDSEFLENYIYNNETIKSKIVDDYMEGLDRSKLPSTMNKGGKISLVAPHRPTTISEAGKVAEKMMRR